MRGCTRNKHDHVLTQLTDVQIHGKLIQFVTLLLAHNCILMDDFIKYVIQKTLNFAKTCLASASELLMQDIDTSGVINGAVYR